MNHNIHHKTTHIFQLENQELVLKQNPVRPSYIMGDLMRCIMLVIAFISFISCTNTGDSNTAPSIKTIQNKSEQYVASENTLPSELNDFTITMKLCEDKYGPDCTELRLGDNFLTISKPANGFLYSCVDKNPNAPGAISDKITWIDLTEATWNLFQKLWLPRGKFQSAEGFYIEQIGDNKREIQTNSLPVDKKIGDWPMTNYPSLTQIDPNPGIPRENDLSLSLPTEPVQADSPTCLSPGVIGITKNGVAIFNAADARGEDAVAREIVDEFGGVDGLITIEDLVEEIVGEIEDEHDAEDEIKFQKINDTKIVVDASYKLNDLEKYYNIIIKEIENEEIDTVGGLAFFLAGKVPNKEEIFQYKNFLKFKIYFPIIQ